MWAYWNEQKVAHLKVTSPPALIAESTSWPSPEISNPAAMLADFETIPSVQGHSVNSATQIRQLGAAVRIRTIVY